MEKKIFHYFKIAFLLCIPISVAVIVRGLIDIDFLDFSAVLNLLLKGAFIGVLTGVILGFINMFAKIDSFLKKNTTK